MPITTAAVHDRYGGPEELQVREVDCPEPGEGRVLVDVRAASVNPVLPPSSPASRYSPR